MSKKVLIIGLDGVSWNVINPMIENGYMPFLQDFIKKGKSGILKSTEPPITPTAWTSFQTGLPPDIHQIKGFINFYIKDGKLQSKILSSSSISEKRIWDTLSEYNRKMCLLNIPLTYPPFPVNGILVSGYPLPSADCIFTHPEDFKYEIFRLIPDFQVMQIGIGDRQKGMIIEDIIDWWINTVFQKANIALYLLKKEPWDVFMVHFQETDLLQHYLWHCIDKNHPEHNPEDFSKVAQFYSKLDWRLSGLVIEARKKGYSTIILSDHGFQFCKYKFRANSWLLQRGYLVLHKNLERSLKTLLKKILNPDILHKIKHFKGIRRNIIGPFSIYQINRFLISQVNYIKSSAIIETNGTGVAFAHFIKQDNLLVKEIIDGLLAIETDKGDKVVKKINKYNGLPYTYKIIFADNIVASNILPDNKPFLKVPLPFKDYQLGVHHMDGIVIFDNSLYEQDLPKEIFEVPLIIMKLQKIPFEIILRQSADNLTDTDISGIENQLKNLGYF
jgi:predicted AlkP superfamily phosphohydrolase/phosphomutase